MNSNLTQEVILRFNQRDEASFKEIFYATYKNALLFSMSITHDYHESEDIVLRIYIKLWNRKEPYNSVEHLERSLLMTVRNDSLNYIDSKLKNVRQATDDNLPIDMIDEPPLLSLIMERNIELIYKAIETFPKMCKQVIKLQLAGLTTDQISKRLNISSDTIYTHHRRALIKLKEFFNENGYTKTKD